MNDNKALGRAEVIAALGAIEVGGVSCKYHGPYLFRMQDALTDAAALLEQDAEPPNDPLTLEELQGMDGEPVWVTPGGFWALVHIAPVGVLLLENSGETAKADEWMERMGSIYRCKPDGGGE